MISHGGVPTYLNVLKRFTELDRKGLMAAVESTIGDAPIPGFRHFLGDAEGTLPRDDRFKVFGELPTFGDASQHRVRGLMGRLAHRMSVPYPFDDRYYGLGLRVWLDGSWGHTGTVENARSMVLHRPDGLTWAVMVNGNAPRPTDELKDLVDTAFAKVGITTD